MIDSKVTKNANGLEPAAPRILARQLARPLTDSEIDHVVGGMIAREIGSSISAARLVPIRARARAAPRKTATADLPSPRRSVAPVGGDSLTQAYSKQGVDIR